jgi:uncharacterized protein (TIGR02646 family)
MIKIDRKRVAEPKAFARLSRAATTKLAHHIARRRNVKSISQNQLPLEEEVLAAPDLRAALEKLFGGKCAFCESPLLDAEKRIPVHFRPRQRAAQLNGKVDPLHYWWLTYEWSNLYSACLGCQAARGPRFPVTGKRAAYEDPKRTVAREKPQLLDPCIDDPESELRFEGDGTVRSTTPRGNLTIDVFGLNRASLVDSRLRHCARIDGIGDLFLGKNEPQKWQEENFVKAVLGEAPPEWGFTALTRQHARRHLANAQRIVSKLPPSEVYIPPEPRRPYHGAVWLKSIQIENFKALRDIELQFPARDVALSNAGSEMNAPEMQKMAPLPQGEPWLMLLGENGVGKSSVLKAIALAMMPASQLRRAGGNVEDWVTRGSRSQSGMIRLEFTVGAQPLELHFSRKTGKVTRKGDYPHMAVLGYGSTRLLPRAEDRAPRPERVRVQNLFDSRAPLRDAEPWLTNASQVKGKNFNLLAHSLKTLLMMGETDRLVRRGRELSAILHKKQVPIRWLSDGYQSVLALALDMMRNLARTSFDMESVEGVVLIDEIENHLHPRWKIAIVGALRELFPRVRFIATTHDPLCVQGIRMGELHVLTRQGEDEDVVVEQFDVQPGMRADQILTGAWFGVPTTRDPETVAMMREHSTLLQKSAKSVDEETRFNYLDKQLRRRLDEYIGTEDEQIALQAVANMRSEDRERTGNAGADSANRLREKVLEALRSKPAVTQGN